VWQSIFSHDIKRYYRVLFRHMSDYTTLVTGPSGTGKELVARAIGQSRYIPFDTKTRRFAEEFSTSFHALNLSALSPTLIESELFGHKRGTFTGAVADRAGWLEVCGALDTVFLDEIGELDPSIQVKLLRVLQTRTFQRLGETTDRQFQGKIIAATNRDLSRLVDDGAFRADFYYRLCSDIITTPSLREQLANDPKDLYNLVLFIAKHIVNEEAEPLAHEVVEWIEANLGQDYHWPGNFRELEQCVRNMLIRRSYVPPHRAADTCDDLVSEIRRGQLTAEQLMQRYCTIVYTQCGSYQAAARRLGLDRRTVQSKVEAARSDARQGG
jgi:transcriptional regulator with GAF, ATPase, and Fis domain